MDQRILLTLAYCMQLIGALLFLIASMTVTVAFTEGQLEFFVALAYVVPLIALGFVWMKNYRYGAPMMVLSTGSALWFGIYLFYLHTNPANIDAVVGDGSGAYFWSTVAIVFGLFVTFCVGTWIWYRENDHFRSMVDSVIYPE